MLLWHLIHAPKVARLIKKRINFLLCPGPGHSSDVDPLGPVLCPFEYLMTGTYASYSSDPANITTLSSPVITVCWALI